MRNQGRFPVTLGYTKRNQGRFTVTLGYTKPWPRPVLGYAGLHKNLTKAGSWLSQVTQMSSQSRFSITQGYTKTKTKASSWLRSITQMSNQSRFPVTHGYTKT